MVKLNYVYILYYMTSKVTDRYRVTQYLSVIPNGVLIYEAYLPGNLPLQTFNKIFWALVL